ncbi:peroxisomal multifunctional enzyme type 2 [Folsomia candida]|uniref:peroxisomal multifunctional enzyme type 2 n=1 Tax=Folsomia candida TaxID=158441 RepID=UPI001604A6C5|nr:peroxisomal multifunctional enzyme type 2 [Folsomia candida]
MFRFPQLASIKAKNYFLPTGKRFASIISDGRGKCDEKFDTSYKVCLDNDKSSVKDVTMENVRGYEFPKVCLRYGREDAIQHALAVGIDESYPNWAHYLDRGNTSFQILPTFLLPVANQILLELSWQSQIMPTERCVHGEIYVKLFQPLKPDGEICFELELVDILDKGKGTNFCYNFHGTDAAGRKIFFIEYQIYEMGVRRYSSPGGQGKSAHHPNIVPLVAPPAGREPDVVLPFTAVPFDPKYFESVKSPPKDMSLFATNYHKQYYAITDKLRPEPRCHGRYYLGAVVQNILKYFGEGDVSRFKSVKTRLSYPVSPGETILTKAWHLASYIDLA